ncbi:MAG TPA: acyltransferase [Terracidiphilus sp.]|jgi:peptidoglycan/LPS O-acetylase OafA/YrhL|nr:acyltransferase [Terracidiphilus sp.]
MAQQTADREQKYVPCLEGVRGYGFLLVFCGHYFLPDQIAHTGSLRIKLVTAVLSMGLFAVPAFFVLSGFLIGGILYETRNREGYFKVFYSRRILRVFPVYYLTLLVIAAFAMLRAFPLNYRYWIHFLYIQNLLPGYSGQHNPAGIMHFWSLAVEEQFYLLWPLIVWFFPERRKLIAIASGLVVACCAARLIAPFVFPSRTILYFSPMRADAILLGVLLAMIRRDAIFDKLKRVAQWIALPGIATTMYLAIHEGQEWIVTLRGAEIWVPLANFTAAAMVLTVMNEGSWINRVCSQKWICSVGKLSYSLYVIHLTFLLWITHSVTPYFAVHMRHSAAVLVSGAVALCMTFALSLFSYRFIESPALSLKRYIRYGPPKIVEIPKEERELAFAKTGT